MADFVHYPSGYRHLILSHFFGPVGLSEAGNGRVTMERYRAPVFWLILSAMFAVFISIDLAQDAAGSRGRGLAVVQQFFRWLLVEPLGLLGAIGLVMAFGALAAALTWPRYR